MAVFGANKDVLVLLLALSPVPFSSRTKNIQATGALTNLIHVASDAGRVVQRKHEFVFGVDNKDSTATEISVESYWSKQS